MDPTAYPVNDFGPAMRGMVIGAVGIVHVFLAQFAIGGGFVLAYFQWLAGRGVPDTRTFLDSFFKYLVLISFVTGAMTGVAMWLTTIQVSAPTIGLMVDEFHWIWATEWTCFAVEITAGYMFLRWGPRLPDGVRLKLLITYSVASFFSLFWVNGILAWQLTPGTWLRSGDVWAGFFNPSFWPSLLYRVAVSSTLAGLAAIAVINTMPIERAARHALIARAARFLLPMAAMPVLGLWYVAVIPDDSREWILGGSVAISMFLGLAAGASLLIAAYALLGVVWRKLYVGGATAGLLLALAFGATAAGEFVREGARKPYTIRQVLFSNAITPGEVARMRREGSVVGDPYPLRDAARYPTAQLQLGARVVRVQCAACHTMRGANALVHLGGNWTLDQLRLNIAKLQRTKAFMPPFAGPPAEVEAVAQLIKWEAAGAPPAWTVSDDPAVLAQIGAWLDEAGPAAYPEARP